MDNLEQNLVPETKKGKKKKIVLIVLICAVALGTVFASWTFLIQPRFFPTIYWKTYKSEKNGFQVKYPRGYQFTMETRTDTDWKFFPFFSETEKESFSLKKETERTTIRFTVYGNPEKFNPREWQNWAHKNNDRALGTEGENNFDFFKDTTINGLPAIDFSFEEPVASDVLIRNTMIISKDDQTFDVRYTEHNTPPDNKNNKAVFDLFLKSLQID